MPAVTKQSNKTTTAKAATPSPDHSVWGLAGLFRGIVYGISGSGKTTFCATMPGTKLWLLCSGGKHSGELRSIDTVENRQLITAKVINTLEDFFSALADAVVGLKADDVIQHYEDLSRYAVKYDTIVLDNGTGFADMILGEVIGYRVPAQKSWGLANKQQYGSQSLQLKDAILKLLGLRCNVVMVAHERTFSPEEGEASEIVKTVVAPSFSKNVSEWMCSSFDYVLRTYKRPKMKELTTDGPNGSAIVQMMRNKGVHYSLMTGPDDLFYTKFRVPRGRVLPDYLDDPSMPQVLAVIDGTYKG